jgi:hypothetical protein
MTHLVQLDMYARHGGVHFKLNVPGHEINRYVDQLPEEKRESMFQVMKELEQANLITIIDDGVLADGEGKLGGSDEC